MNANATTDADWLALEVLDAMELDGVHGAAGAARVTYYDNGKARLFADRSFHDEEPASPAEGVELIASVRHSVGQFQFGEAAPSHVARHNLTIYVPAVQLRTKGIMINSETGSIEVDGSEYFIKTVHYVPEGLAEPAVAVVKAERDASG